jgi:glycosyltransferase involved in cell wall biosynthesis
VRKPTVSIITPSYNQARFVERTLRSVLCQDYADLEYVVFDACSDDGTGDILRKYADALDVLVIEKDKGQADALNRAFRVVRGDILGYLNADDCLASPRTISEVVARFAEHPEADVVAGRRDYMDHDGRFVTAYPFRPFCPDVLRRACFISQEATFWRRRAYEAAGAVINTTYDFAMDYELWLRLLASGARFVAVPDRWGLFRWYAEQKSNSAWRTKGLPEIARLYQAYLGRHVPEQEMFDVYYGYWAQADPVTQPESHALFNGFWSAFLTHKRAALRAFRLDGWVDRADLNRERLRRLRARRGRPAAPARLAA